MRNPTLRRLIASLLGGMLVLSQLAYAVVSEIAISGTNGEPLPNTVITITFPDGTTQEEETDDEGILYFEFPGDGDYKLEWEGGSMMFTPTTSSSGISTGEWIAGGALAIGIGFAASDGSGDSNNNNDNNAPPATQPPTEPPVTQPPTEPPVTQPPTEPPVTPPPTMPPTEPGDGISGSYPVNAWSGPNPCNHPEWPTSFQMDMECEGSSCTASSPDNSDFITCDGSVNDDGNFNCQGTGTFQGFGTDTECQILFFGEGNCSGDCVIGGDGALPGNCPYEGRMECN